MESPVPQVGLFKRCCGSTLAVALALNCLLFSLFFAVLTPAYMTSDDPAMMQIASGSLTGNPSEYLIFTNILIGCLLKQLYLYTPSISWYGVYQYAIQFLGWTAILFSILHRSRSITAYCIYLVIFGTFAATMLLQIQFTMTAAVAAAGGLALLLLDTPRSRRARLAVRISAVGLIVLAAMVREQVFYFSMLLSMPFLLGELIRKRSMAMMATLATSIVCALALIAYHSHAYDSDQDWRQFRQYNQVRGRLHMHPKLQFKLLRSWSTKTVYQRVGWELIDAQMFTSFFFCDPDVYSYERLSQLSQALDDDNQGRSDWYRHLAYRLKTDRAYCMQPCFGHLG